MSQIPPTLPPVPVAESHDQFLQALVAAEDLENLGFELGALRPEQIETLSTRFALSPEQRQRLVVLMAAKFGA